MSCDAIDRRVALLGVHNGSRGRVIGSTTGSSPVSVSLRSRSCVSRLAPARRRADDTDAGQTLVEFALLAPLGFLLLLSVLVVGIVVTNYIQLSNEARDGARVAAICGSNQAALLPDGASLPCTGANISAYITSRLVALPAGSVTPQISVSSGSSTCDLVNPTCHCQLGSIVVVVMSYDQPLYFPLLSNLLESNSNGTVRLTARAEATCEQ